MTRYIEKNKGTQVNSSNIGVQIHPDVAGVTASFRCRLVGVSSTVDIDGTDFQLIRTSKRRVYYCSGETATVTIDDVTTTYVQFVLYASNQASGDVDIVWAQGSSMSDVSQRDNLYTLDYDPDTEIYSNPQRLNSNETVGLIFNTDGYFVDLGPYDYDDMHFDTSINWSSAWVLYSYDEDKMFACRPGMNETSITASGLVTSIEDNVYIGDFYFEPVEPQKEAYDEEGHPIWGFDVDNYVPVQTTVDDYGWTLIGFMPKGPNIGDVMDINADGKQVDSDYNTAEIKEITYGENNCTVSYSVNGSDFTDCDTALTDKNNVICNIPRYMYLKFSQDVEITEE